MFQLIDTLKNIVIENFTLVLNSSSTIIAVSTLIFTIYKFNKQQKINVELEKLKYLFEQNLTNYRIYIELKHKRVIKVNQCIAKAYSSVVNLVSRNRVYPDFVRSTYDQILEFCNEINLGEYERDQIIGVLEIDRNTAINELRHWYDKSECIKANNLINHLKKHLLYVRLYITEEEFIELFAFAENLEEITMNKEALLDEERELNIINPTLRAKIQADKNELVDLNNKAIKILRNVLDIDKIKD